VEQKKVVTINILNDLTRWSERRTLLLEGLAQLQPHLIALQEVRLPENNAQWLADQLGGYHVHLCPRAGNKRAKEGIAILSRLPVEREATLDLGSQQRVAQLVQVRIQDRPWVLANAHLFWRPGESAERVRQVRLMLDWLGNLPTGTAIVVCGDFNGTPDRAAIRLMRDRFASAYAVRHGREPDYTCPTPLSRASLPSLRDVIRGLGARILNLTANHTFKPWHGTLDYVFVNEHVRVVECDLALEHAAPHDRTLYPSDHFGLAATLEVAG
jgi:endonuclease/exonuclease/phosphatase family metal-dependent hydrolase